MTALADMLMIVLVSALMAAEPQLHHASAVAEATATIRVIAGVRLRLDGSPNRDAPPARNAQIRLPDGTVRPAKLIEFQ